MSRRHGLAGRGVPRRCGAPRWVMLWLFLAAMIVGPSWRRDGALGAQTCSSFSITCPGDKPPTISFSPQAGTFTTASISVTIYLSDDVNLNPSTYSVSYTKASSTTGFSPVYSGAASARATGTLTLQPGDGNTITVQICDYANHCPTASASFTYNPLPAQNAPTVTLVQSQDRVNPSACAACAVGVVSYAMPPYFSMDAAHGFSVSYSSATAHPMGLVEVNATNTAATPPDNMSIQLLQNGVPVNLTSGGQELFFRSGPDSTRLAAQFDAPGLATGAYDYTLVVRSWWGTNHYDTSMPVRILIDNEQGSVFGAGWTVPGLKRLYSQPNGSLVMVDGAGGISYFALVSCSSGTDCSYRSPVGDFSTMVKHAPDPNYNNTTYTHTLPDGTTDEFYSDGTLRHQRDRFGNLLRFAYDYPARGPRLVSITDPTSVRDTLVYDGSGNLAAVTDPFGRASTFSVDAAGDLRTIMDPDNVAALQSTAYVSHRLTTFQDRALGQTDLGYDAFGQLASTTGPLVNTTDAGSYRPLVGLRSLELATLPAGGAGLSLAAAAPRILPADATLQITNPRGERTSISQHSSGQALRVEQNDLAGKTLVTTYGYDANNFVNNVTSPSQGTIIFTWSNGLVASVTDQATQTVQEFAYGKYSQLKQAKLNGTIVQQSFFRSDSLLPDSTIYNASDTTRFTYDGRGRILTIVDGEHHTASIAYQTTGVLNTQSVSVNGRTTSYTYDGYGRIQSATDPAGRSASAAYDALNRAITITPPGVASTQYSYDDIHRTYSTTDARNHTYTSVLNASGAVISRTDPNNAVVQFGYDKDGNVTRFTDRRGNTIGSTYDKFGRMLTRAVANDTTWYDYDPNGAWMSARNGESVDTLFRDTDGRPTEESSVRNGIRYDVSSAYSLGQRANLTATATVISTGARVWGHRLTFGYDSNGQQNLVTDFSGTAATWTFNKDGAPYVVTLPTGGSAANNLQHTLTYTPSHRLSMSYYNLLGANLNHTYGYDNLERIVTRDRGASTDAYFRRTVGYDNAGRLASYSDLQHWITTVRKCTGIQISSCTFVTSPHDSTLRSASYTYDAKGNRTDRGGISDANDRLTTFDGFTLTYDADGNLIHKVKAGVTDQTLTWNAFGQLTQVAIAGGSTITFGYDGFGRRIRKTVNGVSTRYVYDGINLLEELDDAGQTVRRYSYYPGVDHPQAVLRQSDGAVFYYNTEQPGSVVALVDKNNQLANTYEYDPFGNVISQSEQVQQPLRFAGAYLDGETGLYFMRARYYDPQLARFISEDPVGVGGSDNLFAFVANDPVNGNDPLGLDLCPHAYHLHAAFQESDGGITIICSPDGGGGPNIAIHELPPVVVTAPWTPPADPKLPSYPTTSTPTAYCGYACAKGASGPPPQAPQKPLQVCSYGDFILMGGEVGGNVLHGGAYFIPGSFDSKQGYWTGGLLEGGLFAFSGAIEFGFNWSQWKWTGAPLGIGGADGKIPGTRAGAGVVSTGAFADKNGNVGGYLTVDGLGGGGYVNLSCGSGS